MVNILTRETLVRHDQNTIEKDQPTEEVLQSLTCHNVFVDLDIQNVIIELDSLARVDHNGDEIET